MPNEEYTKSEFLRALLNQQRQTLQSGGNLVNPSISPTDMGTLATMNTGVQKPVEQEKEVNGFDQFMNNVLGFVDEIAAKFGAGFVNGWEGILDLGATALGAMGWQEAADWAKQDIGAAAAEWSKTAFGLGSWYNRFRNWDWDSEEWKDIGESWWDWNKAAFFANTDMKDVRETLSDKYYGGNDEVLSQMNIGDFRAGEFLGGVAHSIGMMLPSIMTAGAGAASGASQAAQKGISLATLGLGAAGKGSEEAMNEGATAQQALGYGALSGGAEVLSELAVGPVLAKVGLGTGKIMGVVGGKTVKAGSKAFIKELAKNAFEEGMEEVSTALVEPLLKSIYKGSDSLKDYGTKEFWFAGNDSVLGQFASGAFTGGLMSGASISQQTKTFGKEGRNVVNSIAEARESYAKMSQYKEGTAYYNKYMEETLEHLGEAVEAWNGAQDKLSDKQLKNLQQYIQNPGDFMRSMNENRNSGEVITEYMNELKKGEDISLDKFGARETARAIFKAVDMDDYSLKFGKVKNNQNAQIKGKVITINENMTDQAGKFLAHEFGVHALSNSIGKAQINKLYKQIVENKWFDTREGKATDNAYKEEKANNFELYKEEMAANYLQDVVEGKGDSQAQLQYVRDLFSKPSFLQKFLRLFKKNAAKFPSNSVIETEFRNTIQRVVRASNSRIYKSLVNKLRKGEKLNSEESILYRGMTDEKGRNILDYLKPKEAFSKNRNADTINEEKTNNGETKIQNKIIKRRVGKDYNFSPERIEQYVQRDVVDRIEREWANSGLNPTNANQQRLKQVIKLFEGEVSILEPEVMEAYKTFLNASNNTYYEKQSNNTLVEVIKDNYLPPELLAIRNDAINAGVSNVYFSASQFVKDGQKVTTIGMFNTSNKDIYVRIFANSNTLGDFLGTYRHEFMHYALTYRHDLVKKYLLKMSDVLKQNLGGRPNYYYNQIVRQFNNAQNQVEYLESIYNAAEQKYESFGFPNEFQDNFIEWLKTNNESDEDYNNKLADFAINQLDIAFHLEEETCNFYSKGSDFFEGMMEELGIEFSKDRVVGNYTVGDNKQKLVVRRSAKGYEVYFPAEQRSITQAEIGGEMVEDSNGISRRENGQTVKFTNESNVLKYLDDIKANKVEVESKPREKVGKKPETIVLENAPTEAEMRKADETKVSKRLTYKKPIYVKSGDEISKYTVKKIAKNQYRVLYENAEGEIEEREYTAKSLNAELRSYTNISNNRNDLIEKAKPAPAAPKEAPKEKQTKAKQKSINKSANKTIEKVYEDEKAKYKKSLGIKAPIDLETAARNVDTSVVESTDLNVDETMQKAKKEITKIAYRNLKQTRDIIDSSIQFVKEIFGEGYNVAVPINMNDFVNRTFTDINSVKNTDLEAKRLVNKLLETTIEQKSTENGGWEEVGTLEDLLDDESIKSLQIAAKEIIENSDYSKARSIATRNLEIQLEKARAEAQENKTAQGRVRVLTRLRDRIRRNVGRFHEITNDEIIKSGLYTLLDPFEKIHGASNGGFSAKEFRDNLSKTLEWYTEENLSEHYEGLIYNDALRAALEDVYNSLGVAVETKNGLVRKNLIADTMQKSINAIRLINEDIKRMIKNYTDSIAPASIETKKAIARSNYGRRANVIAGLLRMYKRGFAPSYVLIEEILGGNSEAVKILVTDIQNATNEKAIYTGAYHDEINKKLKELGIKKTFGTKKFSFRNVNLTVDQLMGLYISTRVQANLDAINEDGVVVYDNSHNKMVDIAGKGEADALRTEVNNVLPDNYKKFADWLLNTMNDSVKSEYIKWFEDKFGKYQMRNEIGTIKQNSYWMLNRSYQKMDNLSKAVSNPNALFSHAIRRTTGGHNSVMITGALSSFDAYVDKLGREIFIKPKYENALAVLNTKGIDNKSVMDTLSRRNDGTKDINLLRDITRDILGATQRQSNLLDKMVSAFSVAKLSLNIGSMAKQFASAFTSNIPISKTAKALVQRWSPEARAEFNKAFKEIGGLKYREASKGVLRANADSVGQFAEKVAQVGMIGISKVDMFTVSTGVYSLMVIGQDQFNYKIGSDENLKFVKEHWYEYELSQIGNTALSRNAISRSDSLIRYLFGFLQGANRAALGSQIHKFGLWERNRNVDEKQIKNALKEAKERLDIARTEYEADPDSETARKAYIETNAEVIGLNNQLRDYQSYKIAGGKMIMPNMAAGIVTQGIMVALVNALMKRIKGKKDWDELNISEEALALAMAMGVDWIPLVNFVSNIVQGYDVDIPATNLLNQFSAIFKSVGNQNWDTMIRQIAWLAGDMTGIPFQTIYDYIYGTLKTFDPETAYEFRSVFYASSLQSATNSMKTYAGKGNTSKTASMIDLIMKKYKTSSTNDAINNELATLYIAGYNTLPKSVMTQYTNDDGEVVILTSQQITQFMEQYSQSTKAASELITLTEYRNLTAEEKAKAIKKLFDAYYSMAKAKVTGGKVEGKLAQMLVLTNGNIELAKYVLSLQKIAQISENNKKTRKELVLEYINKLSGYTKAEKTLLMYLAGYSVSGNSLKQLTSLLIRSGASRKDIKEIFG